MRLREEEIAVPAEQIGPPEPIELPRANTGWRHDRRPYGEVPGEAERAVSAARCTPEIELLGYEF